MKASADAASFRAYHTLVPEAVRTDIYEEILACEVSGDPDAFERLTVRILAYAASGRMYPAQVAACHDLLALISHSIIARKTQTSSLTVTARVEQTLKQAERLQKAAVAKLPDYGDLNDFLNSQTAARPPDVIDAVEPSTEPTVRLARG